MLTLKGTSGIYCIVCQETGAMYVGSAMNLGKRLAEHCIYGKSNEHLQRALNLYGLKNFKILILEFCDSTALSEREQFYLDLLFELPAEFRYNFGPHPSTRLGTRHSDAPWLKPRSALTGRVLSEDTKLKIRESHLQNPHPFTGKVAFNAMKISVYSLNLTLIAEFSSQLQAAKWLATTPVTLRRHIKNSTPFRNQDFGSLKVIKRFHYSFRFRDIIPVNNCSKYFRSRPDKYYL
jgi:group I intron endonuclease